jgi:hypothetical protein
VLCLFSSCDFVFPILVVSLDCLFLITPCFSLSLSGLGSHSPGLVQSLSGLGTLTLRAWYSHSPSLVQSLSGLGTVIFRAWYSRSLGLVRVVFVFVLWLCVPNIGGVSGLSIFDYSLFFSNVYRHPLYYSNSQDVFDTTIREKKKYGMFLHTNNWNNTLRVEMSRHFERIILIQNQPVFALASKWCVLSGNLEIAIKKKM